MTFTDGLCCHKKTFADEKAFLCWHKNENIC